MIRDLVLLVVKVKTADITFVPCYLLSQWTSILLSVHRRIQEMTRETDRSRVGVNVHLYHNR